MSSNQSSLRTRLHSLPVELRWRICNEILFNQAGIPDLSVLLRSSNETERLDRNIKQLKRHAIFSQKRWSYDLLKVHEIVLNAIKERDCMLLNSLTNQANHRLATIVSKQSLNALRHGMMHSVFFTEGSAQFLLDALLFMERCSKEQTLPWPDVQLLERMVEYCIKEEARILLNSCTTSLLLRMCTGSLHKQLRSIVKLERHVRQTLFEWDNSERLQSYLSALDQQANRHTWTQALLYEMPITTTVLGIWIMAEFYNRNFSFACVKVILLLLLAILGRQVHVAIRRKLVEQCYNTAYITEPYSTAPMWSGRFLKQNIGVILSNLRLRLPSGPFLEQSSLSAPLNVAANSSTDARRPLRTAWLNEVMIKNASHYSLIIESYNAADHYLMTHAFMQTTIQPRQVALLSSAWDLRGTRIVIKRDNDPYPTYWKRGSTFNFHRKPSLLIPKNGRITVIDADFARQDHIF